MPDFTGMATVYDVLCADGRYIKQGAFDHQDGEQVPLVWRHGHEKITNVVGHGILRKSEEPPGMRIDATFNGTKEGRQSKQLVDSKDVTHLSIWANEIIEHAIEQGKLAIEAGWTGLQGGKLEVERGTIREVSLVLAGANPGAKIDDVIRHDADDPAMVYADGVIIHTELPLTLDTEEEDEDTVEHKDSAAEDDRSIADVIETLDADQKTLFDIVMHQAVSGETMPPTAPMAADDDGNGTTVQEVFNTLDESQQNVLYYLAGTLSQESIAQGDQEIMTIHNIFEEEDAQDTILAHEQVIVGALDTARRDRADSLRKFFANQDIVVEHSITDVDFLFPDAQNVTSGGPEYYSRPMEWVERVLNGTSRRPFSRIKTWYTDLTPDAARAKGYVTGNQKVEEVIAVLKRVTGPQTIYKFQKLDRDDVVDITSFDVVVWLKAEMRLMLREELARAILFSDGRANTGDDAIQTANVRPIYNDDPVYTIQWTYNDAGNLKAIEDFTDAELLDLIDFIAEANAEYRGAGSPVFYCAPKVYTRLMLVRDADGRRIHQTKAALADALEVSDIVKIPVAVGIVDEDVVDPETEATALPAGTYDITRLGVIVNLRDYIIGMDRGGETNFFDDFDLNFNKYEYLYETRLSGALIHPKSAIAVNLVTDYTAP